ncbi:right-handed parallel beta-helix repeat-containing protein, partial [Algoriphagus resistens]|uniref:right-handed parallel beta-helix repeat-containing protein n=1 Tax=Algoriphagus resistens TaxID=1750590 RepID=UPI0018E01F61
MFLTFFTYASSLAQVIYVSPNGNGNGSTWAQASNIYDALDNASENSELWLRRGVYTLDEELTLPSTDISVYGGFRGTESTRNQRNFENNKTILDGQNSTRILYLDRDDFTIDGVTFRNGYIGLEDPGDGNKGGGAIYVWSADNSIIRNCTFLNNVSEGDRGAGAVYNRHGDNTLIENCTFDNNRFQSYPHDSNGGGAIHNWTDGLTIKNTVFRNNSSHRPGGAIYTWGYPVIIENCEFEDNHTGQRGGAIYDNSGSIIRITNSLFVNNSASDEGGAISTRDKLEISNSTFVNNNNTAVTYHSYSFSPGHVFIYNSIFFNNSPKGSLDPDIASSTLNTEATVLDIRRNIVKAFSEGTNNLINVNPLFVDSSNGNYRLQSGSPARDAGNINLYNDISGTPAGASNDLDERNRVFNGILDYGAYEYQTHINCTTITRPEGGAD